MLRWLAYIAFVLVLGGELHAQPNDPQQQPAASPADQTQQTANPPIPVTVTGPVSIEREKTVEPNWAKPNCKKPKNHEEADLCQQVRMAEAAQKTVTLNYVQIVIGILTLLGLALTIHFTRRTADTAVAATDLARRAYVTEHRTWIRISDVRPGKIVFDGDKVNVAISFQLENVGENPAINVFVRGEYFLSIGEIIQEPDLEKVIAAEIPSGKERGMIVMPREPVRSGWSSDAKKYIRRGDVFETGKTFISVAYVVFYQSPVSTECCYSAGMAYLDMKDKKPFPMQGTVDGSEVAITDIGLYGRMT